MDLLLFHRIFGVFYCGTAIGVCAYNLIQFVRHRRVVLSRCMNVLMTTATPYFLLKNALNDPEVWDASQPWIHYSNLVLLLVNIFNFVNAFRHDRLRDRFSHITFDLLELAFPDADRGELRRRARELMKLYDRNFDEYENNMQEIRNEAEDRIEGLYRANNRMDLLRRRNNRAMFRRRNRVLAVAG